MGPMTNLKVFPVSAASPWTCLLTRIIWRGNPGLSSLETDLARGSQGGTVGF